MTFQEISRNTTNLLQHCVLLLGIAIAFHFANCSVIVPIPNGRSGIFPLPVETCMSDGKYVTGLKPNVGPGENEIENCKRFWYCRVLKEGVTATEAEPMFKVKADPFLCAEANNSTPYYDASTCQCVSTTDHCSNNHNYANDCTRKTEEDEPIESCRAFANGGKQYFLENIPHYDDKTKFWKCAPHNDTATYVDIPQNCSDSASNLIFDVDTCNCIFSEGTKKDNIVHQRNIHPMNHFKCAFLYPEEKTI